MHILIRSMDLAKLGFTQVENITDKAFLLHDYQYNGFDPDFSKYKKKEEVLHNILIVSNFILDHIKEKEEWDTDLDNVYDIALSDMKKLG